MKRTIATLILAFGLIALGLGVSWYKIYFFQFPLTPNDTVTSWYVELTATIETPRRAPHDALTVELTKPRDQQRLAIASPQIVAPGFGIDETRRAFTLSKRKPKRKETLLYRFSLYQLDMNETRSAAPGKLTPSGFHPDERLANADEATQLVYDSIDTLIEEATQQSSGPISFTRRLIAQLESQPDLARFLQENMQRRDRASLIVELLRTRDIHARVANGFVLQQEGRVNQIQRWIELYHKNKWRRFFLKDFEEEQAEPIYLTWWYGDEPLFALEEGYRVQKEIAVKANQDGAFTRSLWQSQQENSLAYDIALQTLPLQQQLVLQMLLLIPIGALISAFFRQVIGLPMFGTFMPVLVALAFRETGLAYGLAFFGGIIAIGIIARRYLTWFRLLMVPRLSAILCIVILSIVLFMLANKEQTIPLGISVALFPVVIIVMFIERMTTLMDEQGVKGALTGCIGSLFAASVIYVCSMNQTVQHLVMTFPEHLLVVLGGCLMLGRYNGYKLSEYWRFYQLRRQLEQPAKGSSD